LFRFLFSVSFLFRFLVYRYPQFMNADICRRIATVVVKYRYPLLHSDTWRCTHWNVDRYNCVKYITVGDTCKLHTKCTCKKFIL
jgi:hypothetical protein